MKLADRFTPQRFTLSIPVAQKWRNAHDGWQLFHNSGSRSTQFGLVPVAVENARRQWPSLDTLTPRDQPWSSANSPTTWRSSVAPAPG